MEENKIESLLLDLLVEIRENNKRFAGLEKTVDSLDSKIGLNTEKIKTLSARIDRVTQRIDEQYDLLVEIRDLNLTQHDLLKQMVKEVNDDLMPSVMKRLNDFLTLKGPNGHE
jgi:predicted  nucleic acid-binding Zn-ribbon protein